MQEMIGLDQKKEGPQMDKEKIGIFVHELRKEKQMTQKEMADKLGITDKAVSKWERGVSNS